jgi:hypothetical protein
VPSAHNDRATRPCGLPRFGPSGDLSKQPPAALQMLAMAQAMAAPKPSEAQATPASALRAAVC